MLIGIIESRKLPVLIFANKIDLKKSNPTLIKESFPQHKTVPLSALEGENMDEVYDKIVILETGLSPDEESKLIEITMSEIHPEGFTGIEIETHLQSTVGGSTFINK